MSRRSDRDEFDDLDEWVEIVHHKNRKQSDGIRSKRPTGKEKEGSSKKTGSPRRQGNKHPEAL